MAQPAITGGSACISFSVNCDLPFAVPGARTGSHRFTTRKPYPMAAGKSHVFSRTAILHHFREQSFTTRLVLKVTTSPGGRSVFSVCG
jgi:hypothetical protein